MTIRKAVVIVGGILVVLAAGALIVPNFLDWNQYKGQIEHMAEAATGRDVRIEGDVSFKLLPAPSLTANLVSISNLPGGVAPDLAQLEALDVRVALLPLLSRDIQVEKIVLVRPVINLEILEDGRANWDFAGDQEADSRRDSTFRLDRFVVEDGAVTYRDSRTDRVESARAINMLVSADSLMGPVKASGSLIFQEVPLGLNLSMGRRSQQDLAPVTADIQAANSRLAISGIASFGDQPGFEGSLTIAAPDLGQAITAVQRLAGVAAPTVYNLAQPFDASLRLKADQTSLATSAFTFALGESKGSGEVAVTLGADPRANIAFTFTTLDADIIIAAIPEADPARDAVTVADVLAMLDPGDLTGDIRLSADAIRHRGRVIRQAEVTASAADGKLTIRKFHALLPGGSDLDLVGYVTGGDAPRFDGRFAAASNNLRGLFDWLEVDVKNVPPARLTAFAVASDVSIEAARLALTNSMFRLDTMTAKGGMSYDYGGRRELILTADIDRLDISDYLPPDQTCLGTDPQAPQPPAGTKAPPAAGGAGPLPDLALTLKLSVERLSCKPIDGQKVALTANFERGNLTVTALEAAELMGLAVKASGRIDDITGTLRLNLALNAKGASLVAVERAFPDLLPAPARRLGGVDLEASLQGPLANLTFTTSGQVGRTDLKANGRLERDAANAVKAMDLAFAAKNASFAGFIDQWDLALTPPRPADDRPVAVEGTIKGDAAAYNLTLKGEVAGAAIGGRGVVKTADAGPAYDLDLTVKGADARAFVRGLGIEFGEDVEGLGGLNIAAEIAGGPDVLAVNSAKGNFGPLNFSGAATAALGGDRARIDGRLKTGPIVVDRFMGAAKKDAKKQEWSEDPYDLAWLKAFDAAIQIEADKLQARDYLVEAPKMTLLVQDGRLEVRDLTGKMFGGDVALHFAFGGADVPAMTLGFNIQNASMESALATAANVKAVTGRLNLQGNFRGAGASPAALVRSITGDADLGLSEGVVRGIDLPRLSTQMKDLTDAASLGRLLTAALSGGETAHKGFNTLVQAQNGELSLSNLVVELDAAKALLGARINLPEWRVGSSGRLQLTGHSAVPPIGFDIGGSLSDPEVTFNSKEFQTAVAAQIGRALIERAAGGGLEGLLGRDKPASPATPSTEQQPPAPPPAETQPPSRVLFDQLLKSLGGKEKRDGQPQP